MVFVFAADLLIKGVFVLWLNFYLIERGGRQNKEVSKKWFPRLLGDLDIQVIAEAIARIFTVFGAGMHAVLFGLVELLTIKLKQGFRLKLNDFGIFYIFPRWVGTAEKRTAAGMESDHLSFIRLCVHFP